MAFLSNIQRIDSNLKGLLKALKDTLLKTPLRFFHRFNLTNIQFFFKYVNKKFHCPNCGADTKSVFCWPDLALRREHNVGYLREDLTCKNCLASMRGRMLSLVFLNHLNARFCADYQSLKELSENCVLDLHVLNTDKFSVMNPFFANSEKFWLSGYFPDKPNGSKLENNVFNVDLQSIPFEDNTFDVILTSDVMEHVRDSEKAHREIFRVLKPGGIYIFTVPYNPELEQTRILVDTTTDEDVFLCRPQYHGDPLTGGILTYRIFGKSLLTELKNIEFSVNDMHINSEKHLILNGDVFCAIKPKK